MQDKPAKQSPDRLKKACPEVEISTDPAVLESHGQDWTRFYQPAPLAVAFPRDVAEVQQLVRFAASESLAIVPSGGARV